MLIQINKKFSGYGIKFNLRSKFPLPDSSMGKNVIIFEIDLSSSVHVDSKNKDILIFGEGPTQGLHNTALIAEAQYSTNFSRLNRRLCLSLHYNERNSFLFVNATEIYHFKANDSEIKIYPWCLGNISKYFAAINMKKQDLLDRFTILSKFINF